MKISIRLDGDDKTYTGEDTGTRVLVTEAKCPKCKDKHAIVDDLGVIRALASPSSTKEALADAKSDGFSGLSIEPPDPAAPLYVYMPSSNVGSDDRSYVGRAECWRCRQFIGSVTVDLSFDTLFGIEEDQRMLGASRRWRVY